MSMKFKFLFSLAFAASTVVAQVPKKVVVEHFTNTRCGICGSKNPGFYNNLSNFPDVIHLAIHPSSPYSNCVLNQQNVVQNDARTHFYGVYGSTPRLVIQGEVQQPSVNFNDPGIFSAKQGEMSDFELSIVQEYASSTDSVRISVTIKRIAVSTETNAVLYAALAEREVNYDAPNGEDVHHDVFRTSFFGDDGQVLNLPTAVDESLTYKATVAVAPQWKHSELYSIVILQEENTFEVLQAASAEGQEITGVQHNVSHHELRIYPNPFEDQITMEGENITQVRVLDMLGHVVYTSPQRQKQLHLAHLSAGTYVLEVSHTDGISYQRIMRASE